MIIRSITTRFSNHSSWLISEEFAMGKTFTEFLWSKAKWSEMDIGKNSMINNFIELLKATHSITPISIFLTLLRIEVKFDSKFLRTAL